MGGGGNIGEVTGGALAGLRIDDAGEGVGLVGCESDNRSGSLGLPTGFSDSPILPDYLQTASARQYLPQGDNSEKEFAGVRRDWNQIIQDIRDICELVSESDGSV
jgi:hypothetical protein